MEFNVFLVEILILLFLTSAIPESVFYKETKCVVCCVEIKCVEFINKHSASQKLIYIKDDLF